MGSIESRDAWAKQFAESIGRRKADIQAGAPKRVGKSIADAIKAYFKEHGAGLRPRTLKTYADGADTFLAWTQREGITNTAELTPERLYAFRSAVASVPKRGVVKGGKSGERAETRAKRSPNTIDRYLRTIATILNKWRKAGLVPQLHSDDISDQLERFKGERDEIDFLTGKQCKALLVACLKHDADAVRQARPIAPFTAALLLGGFRAGEALGLQWSSVDAKKNFVSLPPASTKTKIGRRVTLAESPALALLLDALKPSDAEGSIFGQTEAGIQMTRARLIEKYGAPKFTWQQLRRTCATFTWNMPVPSPHKAAKRSEHSLAIAESRYADRVQVPKTARTLEGAMQIAPEIERVIKAVKARDMEWAPLWNAPRNAHGLAL